jgi:hypothetical protein
MAELIALQEIVLPFVVLINTGLQASRQTNQFLALHGLSLIEDFDLLEPHQAKDMVKASNSRHPAQSQQPHRVDLVRQGHDPSRADNRPKQHWAGQSTQRSYGLQGLRPELQQR